MIVATAAADRSDVVAVRARPRAVVGAALYLAPLFVALVALVPFAHPDIEARPGMALLSACCLAVAVTIWWLHERSILEVTAGGWLRIRGYATGWQEASLTDVARMTSTPGPCARGHVDCCANDGTPTLHLHLHDGRVLSLRTGWWTNEAAVLAELRRQLRIHRPGLDVDVHPILATAGR